VAKKYSVREAEELVRQELSPSKARIAPVRDRDVVALEEELSDRLGTRVVIQSKPKGRGRLAIDYGSLDQLEGLLAKLRA
jgi:ParB family chromosome partitioning protein